MDTVSTPEGRTLLHFHTRDMPRYLTGVLVIGGGVAGLSAARAAAQHDDVLVVLKDPPQRSNTAWAQGGIAAAIGAGDSTAAHARDTLRTGCGLCDREIVDIVTRAAPRALRELAGIGARFDRAESESASDDAPDADVHADEALPGSTADATTELPPDVALGREGGHGRARILHSRGDATGAETSRALVTAAARHPRIQFFDDAFVVDLLTVDARCVGALIRRPSGELAAVFARSVVLAAGGAGRLYRETSNVRGATGDGVAAAYRAGATLRDLEFVQFHPTTLYLAGSERTLVTEAVRGAGGHLVDDHGRRFMTDIHADAELAPRDVVSQAIVHHLAQPDVQGVFLDLRHWPRGKVARRFPGLVHTCSRYGLDPERDPIPVRPAAHYFIGGIAVDADGRSDLDGLFACGEASATGLHGANRLASNSLLEGLVLGARAGHVAATEGRPRYDGHVASAKTAKPRDRHGEVADWPDLRESLESMMWRRVGIVRDASGLTAAATKIAQWRHFTARVRLERRSSFELQNLLMLAELVTAAAMHREESRGTHLRSDFRERDDVAFLGSFYWHVERGMRFERLPDPTDEPSDG